MSKAELPAEVVEQHIGWLKLYLESMTVDNWQDNKARGLRQLAELSTDARKIIAAERERCAKIAEEWFENNEAVNLIKRANDQAVGQEIAKAIRGASSSAATRPVINKPIVKVQVRDPETDELLEEKILNNDYVVVCCGNRYIKSMQVWGSTHQLNIAREK